MSAQLHMEPEITCWPATRLDFHFEGRCEDCDARAMSRMTRGEAQDRYETGRLSQEQYEAHAFGWWSVYPARGSDPTPPEDPAVRRIAAKILHFYRQRQGGTP